MDIFNLATVDFLSVVADDVVEVVLVEIGEGEIIADFHGGSLLVEIKELDVLVYFSHLFCLRLDTAVGVYHAVDAEIAVGGRAVLAIIAAIGPVFTAVVCLGGKALVYPVPDTAALEDGIFSMMSQYSWKLPRLLPMAWAYSQRMRGRVISLFRAYFSR